LTLEHKNLCLSFFLAWLLSLILACMYDSSVDIFVLIALRLSLHYREIVLLHI